jgi:hypothetical protein
MHCRLSLALLLAGCAEMGSAEMTPGGPQAGWAPMFASGGPPGTLSVLGVCPGTMEIRYGGLTPGGLVGFLAGNEAGAAPMSAGPCVGVTTGLDALTLVHTEEADALGEGLVTPTLSAPTCGRMLQLVDVSTCTLTPVTALSGAASCVDLPEPVPELADPDDCNANGVPDDTDLGTGYSVDCDLDGILDECEVLDPTCVLTHPEGWTAYHSGTLPVVLTVPHDGTLKPAELDDRPGAGTGSDTSTLSTAWAIADAMESATGGRPHVVVMHLHRDKVEANVSPTGSPTAGAPEALAVYDGYHAFIEAAGRAAESQHGSALVLDIHGLAASYTEAQLGYLLPGTLWAVDDGRLDHPGTAISSSLRTVAESAGDYSGLTRGEYSLGGLLAARGYASVPSPDFLFPTDAYGAPYNYNNGGYSTLTHTSQAGGGVSGLQIEHIWAGVRDSGANRAAYGAALTESLTEFMDHWMDLSLAAATVSFARPSITLWETGGVQTVEVTRTGDLSDALSVPLVLGGEAVLAVDYVMPEVEVIFGPDQARVTLALAPLDDHLVEGPETLTLSLARAPGHNRWPTQRLEVVLVDDEWTGVAAQADDRAVTEGAWTRIRLTRDQCETDQRVHYTLSTPDDVDVAPNDGVAGSWDGAAGWVSLSAGERGADVAVKPVADGEVEGMEILTLDLVADPEYAAGAGAQVEVDDGDLDPDLVAWYTGAAHPAGISDLSGAGHHAVAMPSVADGPIGSPDALLFDGTDDLLAVDGFNPGQGDVSVAFWFKLDDSTAGAYTWMFSHRKFNTSGALSIYITPSGYLRTVATGRTEAHDVWLLDVYGDHRDDLWTHYAVTVDTSTPQTIVYRDGAERARGASGAEGVFTDGIVTVIGNNYENNWETHFNGSLRDLRVYRRALGAEQVSALAGL